MINEEWGQEALADGNVFINCVFSEELWLPCFQSRHFQGDMPHSKFVLRSQGSSPQAALL